MADCYKDNRNLRWINGFSIHQAGYGVWSIDEFGIDLMYLIEGKERALLFDTGVGISDIRGVIETLTALPYDVVNSHHHYDHVGGNYHFEEVFVHKAAIPVIEKQNNPKFRREFLLSQEARKEFTFEAGLRYDAGKGGSCKLKPLQEGQIFDLGGRKLEVLFTPGHTADSVCLLDHENRLLFSADTVVSTPTLIFKSFSEKMAVYLDSLKKLRSRREEYELIYPGHFLHPIGSLYVDQLIRCAEQIMEGRLLNRAEENKMAGAPVYEHQYGRASILYTEDTLL